MLFVYLLYNQGKSIYNISFTATKQRSYIISGSEIHFHGSRNYTIVVLRLRLRGSEFTFLILRIRHQH